MNRIKYLLGIDGGGTKTEFLLTDLNGKEINRAILGASNPVNAGIENTKAILQNGILQVCESIDCATVSVFAGIAGGISGNNQALINEFLSKFGFGALANGSDADNALETALKGKNGVAVIMGTGIIAYSMLDGECHRIGGRGYLIDKGGSGFHFGSDALNSAFEYIDGRGGSELLLQLVEERLGKPLAESVADIYSGGAAYIASFAPAVFDAFEKGDRDAKMIIDINTAAAAKIIRTACEYSNSKEAVICGGLCRKQNILKLFLIEHLGKEYSLIFSDEPPINGAVSLAKSLV